MNEIDYLIISSTIDYSTDLVCYQLMKSGKKYYRFNRDEFSKHDVKMDLKEKRMVISIKNETYVAYFDKLVGVFFRAPIFLRTQTKSILSVEEQLERNQWNAFLRNLVVFENANWINNPANTYRAENKVLQLKKAEDSGLLVPKTYVANYCIDELKLDEQYIVKSLDTALFYDVINQKEMFTYSTVVTGKELEQYNLKQAPVFIQEFLNPKIDCRITYVDGTFFSFKILQNGKGMFGDWRVRKEELEYELFELPGEIKKSITRMMDGLHLKFGGIDLALVDNNYYFIEVNPTGEWGWLEIKSGIEISSAISNALER